MTLEEGYQEALRRIEEARQTGVTELDLRDLGLTAIPVELASCRSLRKLIMGGSYSSYTYNRLSRIENLPDGLQTLDLNLNQISKIENLPDSLQVLDLSSNEISRIENLPVGLQVLNLRGNQILELENLPDGLRELNLIYNQIGQIKGLPDSLQILNILENQIRRIENLPSGLQVLDLSSNKIDKIENLPNNLQTLDLKKNKISVLENLPNHLHTLDLSENQISELADLPNGLQTLNLSHNQIRILKNIPDSLHTLDLIRNKINDIKNLPAGLQSLNLSYNYISELVNLPNDLQILNLNANRVSQLKNLPTGLHTIDLSRNNISKIENLPIGLQALDLNRNHIAKIENLPDGLLKLILWLNQISQLENLPTGLDTLDLSYNHISKLENLPTGLKTLRFYGNMTKNIPSELLGEDMKENCLYNVRVWFADLAKGEEKNTIIKFMVSGNSNVGKSSLIEGIRMGKAQSERDSTHGICIESLPLTDGAQQIDGIVFDFGGQEIYHGTHQLFLRSRAVQLVVFDAEIEAISITLDRRSTKGETNRNRNLPNWLDELRRWSAKSAYVLVQNKIDVSTPLPPDTQSLLHQLESDSQFWIARVSAETGRGIPALRSHLVEAAQSLPEYNMHMPSSWYMVRQYFLQNSQKPIAERQRIVSREFFTQLCAEHNVPPVSESVLLRYLHNAGIVYYDAPHPSYHIVADQQWIIEAIYEVLDRQGRLYDELTYDSYGKKRLKYLFSYFNQTYTTADKKMFVMMMESCGLCFPLKEDNYRQFNDDTYYLFPHFLPDDLPDSVQYFLADVSRQTVYQQAVSFLPYYHIQQLISRWGAKSRLENIWRNGLLVKLSNEGGFVLEADFANNILTLTVERTISAETINRLHQELGYQDAVWQLNGEESVFLSEKVSTSQPSGPVLNTLPDVVQPKIKRFVVSFAKEDVRYVDLLRKKMSARKTIDLWYDRHIDGWSDWDSQIQDRFMDCDGYIIFLSDTYMDAEMKTYIHEKEIPLIRQRFDAKEVYVAIINVTPYNTQYTDIAPFLSFRKAALMPDPTQQPAEASQFLEAFINEKIFGDFLKRTP